MKNDMVKKTLIILTILSVMIVGISYALITETNLNGSANGKTIKAALGVDIPNAISGGSSGKTTSSVKNVASKIQSVFLHYSKTTINVGETLNASITVNPSGLSNVQKTFFSSNTSAVEVDNKGRITGVGGGSALITLIAKCAGDTTTKVSKVTITVKAPEKATGGTDDEEASSLLSATELTGFTGDVLTITYNKSINTSKYNDNPLINRISDVNTKYLEVTTSGNTIYVKIIKRPNTGKTSFLVDKQNVIVNIKDTNESTTPKPTKTPKVTPTPEPSPTPTLCPHTAKESVYVDVGNSKTHEVWIACKICKQRITRQSAASNHTFGPWLPDSVAGRSYRECSDCKYREITYSSSPQETTPKIIATITIPKEVTYLQGAKVEVKVSPSTESKINITYSSEDEGIASISNVGTITGIKKGKTKITVSVKQGTTNIKTVVEDVEVKESKTSHEYVASENWTVKDKYHYKACDYPDCLMVAHKTPLTFDSETRRISQYGKHEYSKDNEGKCECGKECEHKSISEEVINPRDANVPGPKLEAIATILAMSDDDKNNNHILVSTCIYCNRISAASLEKHDFKANEKDPFFHECTKCNAQHDLKLNHYYEEQEPKPANCTHGNITYKKCNVCGIEFDEKDDGEVDLNKHEIINIKGYEYVPGDQLKPEIDDEGHPVFHHKVIGDCSICSEKDVFIIDKCHVKKEIKYLKNLSEPASDPKNYLFYDDESDPMHHWYYYACYQCTGKAKRISQPHIDVTDESGFSGTTAVEYKYVDETYHNALCICGRPTQFEHPSKSIIVISPNVKEKSFLGLEDANGNKITLHTIIEYLPKPREWKFSGHDIEITEPGYHYVFSYCSLCKAGVFTPKEHSFDSKTEDTAQVFDVEGYSFYSYKKRMQNNSAAWIERTVYHSYDNRNIEKDYFAKAQFFHLRYYECQCKNKFVEKENCHFVLQKTNEGKDFIVGWYYYAPFVYHMSVWLCPGCGGNALAVNSCSGDPCNVCGKPSEWVRKNANYKVL